MLRKENDTCYGTWSWMGCLGLKNNEHKTMGYSDDLMIMAPDKYNTTVRKRKKVALNIVKNG